MLICIHICSGREWRSTKEIFEVKREDIHNYPLGEYFNQEIQNNQCLIYHSGPTKTRAAAACQYAIEKWKPDVVIVLGTCGGVSENLKIFDIVMANKTVQYDCLDFMDGTEDIFNSPMTTELDNSWVDINNIPEKITIGIIGTADKDLNHETAKLLRKENVLVVDWESGAITKICELNKVKCLVLRGISDKPVSLEKADREKQTNDYRKNTHSVMERLISLLPIIVKSTSGKFSLV